MRICLVSQEYPPDTAHGGIGTQTWNKAHTLALLGHEVHVLSCAAGPGPELSTTHHDGISVHRMQPPGEERGREFPVFELAVYNLGYAWSVARFLHQLMEHQAFDLIDFAEYGAEGFLYQLNRTRWNFAPVVVQLHGPLAMCSERYGWPDSDSAFYRVVTYVEDISIKRADALMACSANIASFTADFHNVPRDSIDVVHCGVDTDMFTPPSHFAPANGRPTVLFVGNLAANKGVDTVLEAVLGLRHEYPDIRLRILGKADADAVRRLRARTATESAAANVEINGFVADRAELPDYYRSATVFCSPAYHEVGVANVYIEAMACGCPVVASKTGGAPEAIEDGKTGFLVAPQDSAETADAIRRILGDSALRNSMADAARAHAESYFAMDAYMGRVLATYDRARSAARNPA